MIDAAEIAKKSQLVFEAVTKAALTGYQLEQVRKDRNAGDAIFDAASAHRAAEAAMNEAVAGLVELQIKQMREAPQT